MTFDDLMNKQERTQETLEELQEQLDNLTNYIEEVESRLSNRQEACFIFLAIFLVIILIKVW